MKKVLFLLVAMVLLLAACGGESEGAKKVEGAEDTTEKASASEGEKKEEKKEEAKDQVFKVGDTVELGNAQVTLKSAKFIEADEFMPAEKGAVLAIEFEATNKGDDSLYIGAEEFKISTPDGMQHEQYFSGNSFMNENISAGKKIAGTMLYDVPKESKYEINYEPTFTLSSETATFEIVPQ